MKKEMKEMMQTGTAEVGEKSSSGDTGGILLDHAKHSDNVFRSQQGAERALKVLFLLERREIPFSHNVVLPAIRGCPRTVWRRPRNGPRTTSPRDTWTQPAVCLPDSMVSAIQDWNH